MSPRFLSPLDEVSGGRAEGKSPSCPAVAGIRNRSREGAYLAATTKSRWQPNATHDAKPLYVKRVDPSHDLYAVWNFAGRLPESLPPQLIAPHSAFRTPHSFAQLQLHSPLPSRCYRACRSTHSLHSAIRPLVMSTTAETSLTIQAGLGSALRPSLLTL